MKALPEALEVDTNEGVQNLAPLKEALPEGIDGRDVNPEKISIDHSSEMLRSTSTLPV